MTGVHPYGCFIECFADHGGLVQKADLDIQRTLKPEDVWMEGDYMDVICLVGGEKARFSRCPPVTMPACRLPGTGYGLNTHLRSALCQALYIAASLYSLPPGRLPSALDLLSEEFNFIHLC